MPPRASMYVLWSIWHWQSYSGLWSVLTFQVEQATYNIFFNLQDKNQEIHQICHQQRSFEQIITIYKSLLITYGCFSMSFTFTFELYSVLGTLNRIFQPSYKVVYVLHLKMETLIISKSTPIKLTQIMNFSLPLFGIWFSWWGQLPLSWGRGGRAAPVPPFSRLLSWFWVDFK